MADEDAGTVKLNIGGQVFEVLEQTIRSRPETLLCTMLDDPAREDQTKPKGKGEGKGGSTWSSKGDGEGKGKKKTKLLSRAELDKGGAQMYVEADPQLFRYIMAWYRYGSILLPAHISIDEMRRECAFYQLPDDVKVLRERWTVRDASMAAAHQKERILEAAARLKAECLIAGLLQDPCLYQLTALTEEWVAAEMNEDRDDIMEYLVECDEHLDAAVKSVAAREGLDACCCKGLGKNAQCSFRSNGKGYDGSYNDSKGKRKAGD